MAKFSLKGIKGSLKGMGGKIKGIGSSFSGIFKRKPELKMEEITKKVGFREIPTGRKIEGKRETVKVPGKKGAPTGPTLESLKKSGEFWKGIEKEKEVIKFEPTKTPEQHVLELMGKESKATLSPEKRQQFLNEIQTFIKFHGKELGPQKTIEEIKKRWPQAWSDVETRRKIAEMTRPTFTSEEWKKGEEERAEKKEGKLPSTIENLGKALTEKKCQWCKRPIPRGAKVCPHCGREQTAGGEPQIKGVVTGGIVSGILYALSYFRFLPIPLDFYFLGGIFVCCILLSLKTNAAKVIGALGLIGIGGFYAMSIPIVQALIPMRQINEVLYELNIKKDYVHCLITHLTDVENIMSYGGLSALCKKILGEVKVVKEGCVECLRLKVGTEVPLVTPGSSFLFRLEYSMDGSADLPATDIITKFYVDDEKENVTRCNEKHPCTLYPNDFEETSVKLNKSKTIELCFKDKDYFKYTVSTMYNYTTKGDTHFYITNNMRIYERKTAITSSGPLDIIVSSDSSYYRIGDDSYIFLAFAFVNKGEGEIKINELKIVEFSPANKSLLKNDSCDVNLDFKNSAWYVNVSEEPLNYSLKGGKKIMFGCSIPISNVSLFFSGPFVTYTYQAVASYTYEKNQTGQVWVDKDYCEFFKKTTETPSGGTGGGSQTEGEVSTPSPRD